MPVSPIDPEAAHGADDDLDASCEHLGYDYDAALEAGSGHAIVAATLRRRDYPKSTGTPSTSNNRPLRRILRAS